VGVLDPRRPGEVGAALVAVAAERFGGPVDLAVPAEALGDGFDSHIHAVTLAGPTLPEAWRAPLVVRLLPSVDRMHQARTEAEVQRWCGQRGYPVPEMLLVLEPDEAFGLPAQVMARAPGGTVLDALKARPWRAGALVDDLAALHVRLHSLSPEGWPASSEPTALVDQRLSLPRRVVDEGGPEGLAAAVEAVGALVPIATEGDLVVCHGDFHPLNVVVDGADAAVIDWTDAGLGPREADLARTLLLFHVVAIVADGRVERAVLGRIGPVLSRRYARAYGRTATLDERRMLAWEALHAVHGWAQVHTLHAGGFDGATSADASQVPPDLADFLRAKVDRALATLT
jgi:aminoglycoside phosphotransferase (APT) family kinase protein